MDDYLQQRPFASGGAASGENCFLSDSNEVSQTFLSGPPTTTYTEPLQTVQPQALYIDGGRGSSTSENHLLRAPSSSSGSLTTHLGIAQEHHGQYTPESDDTPTRDPKPRFRSNTSENRSKSPDSIKPPVKRKKQSKGSSVAESSDSPPKRNPRKNWVQSDSEDIQKRELFLHRNRMAASKCRQKKKEWTANLDETCRDLDATNRMLHAELSFLNAEAYELKNKLLEHSNCGFPPIEAFIQTSAQRVAMIASQSKPPANSRPSVGLVGGRTEIPSLPSDIGTRFELSSKMEAQSNTSGSRSRSTTVEADSLQEGRPWTIPL